MKTAIITLTGDNNYGNKLQNLALQQVLRKNKSIVKTIRISNSFYLLSYIKVIIKTLIFNNIKKNNNCIRKLAFYRFNKNILQNYFDVAPINHKRIKKILCNYDYVFYGSDQIWNTEFKSFNELFLGACAPKEKNIAASASFGTDEIDSEYIELFKKGLHNFKAISVREERGRELVKETAGLNAVVLPDPTLALNAEEWHKYESKIKTPEKYCVKYFLGTDFYKDTTIDENGLKVVSAQPTEPIGPGEFLYLIHNADEVATDSFHACVFSVIFGVPFRIYKRKDKLSSMFSRITTLFNIFGFEAVETENYFYISKEEVGKKSVKEQLRIISEQWNDFIKKNTEVKL